MKCKGTVYKGGFHRYPCSKNEWKDGYCKIHHPEEKTKRNKARNEKYEREYEEAKLRKGKVQDELWEKVEKEYIETTPSWLLSVQGFIMHAKKSFDLSRK